MQIKKFIAPKKTTVSRETYKALKISTSQNTEKMAPIHGVRANFLHPQKGPVCLFSIIPFTQDVCHSFKIFVEV